MNDYLTPGCPFVMPEAAPLTVKEALVNTPLVAYGRPARLIAKGKPRKNAAKAGGLSLSVTLRFEDDDPKEITLVIPSEQVYRRDTAAEAEWAMLTAHSAVLDARHTQVQAEEAYQLAKAEVPQVFEIIEARAKANAAEKDAAARLRQRASYWINEEGGDPERLPEGLQPKTRTEWQYDRAQAVRYAARRQPDLLVVSSFEGVMDRLLQSPEALDALQLLTDLVPELFSVDDKRFQKLLEASATTTRTALAAKQVAHEEVVIATKLGRTVEVEA